MAYLTIAEAETILEDTYGFTDLALSEGDVRAATLELDRYGGPFIGSRQEYDQAQAFPRTVNPDGTTNVEITAPAEVLDWVALRAYELSREDTPPVTSRGLIGASVTYGRAAVPRSLRLRENLISRYQLKVGERL